jgi:membrane protease subunit HflK
MPWNNQTGGGRPGGGGRGPWGGGPSGGNTPPDLEAFLRRSQENCARRFPRGFGGGGALVVGLIVLAVWLMSGVYVVNPDEQGVVLRFGAFVGRTTPGINYHLPWPIETRKRRKSPRRISSTWISAGQLRRRARRAGRKPDADRR